MKKGPVCYLYYTIKNKRKEKQNNSDLYHNNSEIEIAQQKEFIDA
jgi:hypothetical protein